MAQAGRAPVWSVAPLSPVQKPVPIPVLDYDYFDFYLSNIPVGLGGEFQDSCCICLLLDPLTLEYGSLFQLALQARKTIP
ncbi:hypothetical protein [Acidithrix sp. C25]|uniref:Uncharacterized protein n=1 Tax=Acidithrix ferrooxidans TaxID=1280514 RepID=A0A0D8HK65_9ACTN|nr:hypothetical protein [Acidithrix sp. C25]KJF17486.1 hypothetical protein AXFE_16490 [Acidithrix ferrooxidans]